MWAFIRKIRTSPIYLREQGRWGEPNQYYATMIRYLPIVVLIVLGLSIMCGWYQLAQLFGMGELGLFLAMLLCLPNIAIQVLTWIGIILAPALTAPAVVEEMDQGSWEILRLTPVPTIEIVIAKFLGSLSRMKIWIPLIIVSVIYALAIGVGSAGLSSGVSISTFAPEPLETWQIIGIGLLSIIGSLARPWLEISFAGLVGLTLSLWTNSARAALIGSYSTILFYRLVLNSIIWVSVIIGMVNRGYEGAALSMSTMSLNILYLVSCIVLFYLLNRRASAIDRGEGLYE